MTQRILSLFSYFARWSAPFATALVAWTAPAAAQPVSPAQAPVEWVHYAEQATATITQWLRAESKIADRLRAYIDATRPSPDQPTAPITLKVWIDGEGAVSRIDFPPFAHIEPNADLRGLLVGQRLPGIPPTGMLLPLRITVQLDPPAQSAPATSGDGPASDPRKLI